MEAVDSFETLLNFYHNPRDPS